MFVKVCWFEFSIGVPCLKLLYSAQMALSINKGYIVVSEISLVTI